MQYPGAGEALLGDLRQLARVREGMAPVFPGIDIKPLVEEVQARAAEELDYRLEAEAQRGVRRRLPRRPRDRRARRRRRSASTVLVTEWMESTGSLATVIAKGTREERDHYGSCWSGSCSPAPARTGMLHADPHPGNFRILPNADGSPGRLGVLDFGAVARLPDGRLPARAGPADPARPPTATPTCCSRGCAREGFVKRQDPGRPAAGAATTSRRSSSRPASTRSASTARGCASSSSASTTRATSRTPSALKLNLPPAYLLIHRTWLGGIGLLSQLEAEAPFRSILEESLPGFAEAERLELPTQKPRPPNQSP